MFALTISPMLNRMIDVKKLTYPVVIAILVAAAVGSVRKTINSFAFKSIRERGDPFP